MSFEATTDTDSGWTDVTVNKEFLEKSGFLWYINQTLHPQGMRLFFKMDVKGVPQLHIMVLPDTTGPSFEYTAEATQKHSHQWNDFLRTMRP